MRTLFSELLLIHLKRPWTRAFFRPASRTVGFSLRFKNSGHVTKFFVALWFAKQRVYDPEKFRRRRGQFMIASSLERVLQNELTKFRAHVRVLYFFIFLIFTDNIQVKR